MSRAILFAALGVGLILRLALAIGVDHPLVSDERDYDALARSLAETGRYAEDGVPTAARAPLYPTLVAAVYRAGGNARAVAAVQGGLDLLVALLLYRLLRRRDLRAAAIAAAGWALYPAAILYSRLLLTETIFTVAIAAWIAMVDRERPGGQGLSVFAGAWLGVLVLIRPIALVLACALPWIARGEGGQRSVRWAPFCLGLALLLAPWVARNAVVLGTPALTTSIGGNLWIGNHPRATGGYAPPEIDEPGWLDRSEVEANRVSLRRAVGSIVARPDRFLRNGALKLAHALRPEGELLVQTFLLEPRAEGVRHRVLLARIPIWLYGLVSGPYAIVALLGCLGLVTFPPDRLNRATIAMALGWAAVIFVFFGSSRFHEPLMPFLMLFAARSVRLTRAQLAAVPRRRWIGLAILSTVLIGIWGVEAWFVLRSAA